MGSILDAVIERHESYYAKPQVNKVPFTDNINIEPCELEGFVVTVGSSMERCTRGKRYVARGADGLSSLLYNIVSRRV